ncbi:hypothetical protein [Paraglaciecola marina]|uniref:hypothetical protein n=1 Tax=Paraglaciecola marina TaxID=2500157 RepID=UPI0010600921|nr:hypothetical protein [Paraglaciecola marina]
MKIIEIVEIAKIVRNVFLDNRDELDIPHFFSFPENCCEGASLFLGYYLFLRFPDNKFEIIRGLTESAYDHVYHLWLEVDGHIFDLTIDQFPEYENPIFNSQQPHPMSDIFIEDKRLALIIYLDYYFNKVVESERFTKSFCRFSELVKINT